MSQTVGQATWPPTHPAAPGRSQAPPSSSLSSRGCPLGPHGLSFSSRSSCPLFSSQTALHQGREQVVIQNCPSQNTITACHPRSAPSPGTSPPSSPCPASTPQAQSLGGPEVTGALGSQGAPSVGESGNRCSGRAWGGHRPRGWRTTRQVHEAAQPNSLQVLGEPRGLPGWLEVSGQDRALKSRPRSWT